MRHEDTVIWWNMYSKYMRGYQADVMHLGIEMLAAVVTHCRCSVMVSLLIMWSWVTAVWHCTRTAVTSNQLGGKGTVKWWEKVAYQEWKPGWFLLQTSPWTEVTGRVRVFLRRRCCSDKRAGRRHSGDDSEPSINHFHRPHAHWRQSYLQVGTVVK